MKHKIQKRLLTAREVATYCGVSPKTICEWTKRGILPVVRIPHTRLKYDLQDLDRIILECKKKAVPEKDEEIQKVDQILDEIFNKESKGV